MKGIASLVGAATIAASGCTKNCVTDHVEPFDNEGPRTILATLEVYGEQSLETTGLLAIHDVATDEIPCDVHPNEPNSPKVLMGYHYSALLRNARLCMRPEGNIHLERGILYFHAKRLESPIVDARDAGESVALDGDAPALTDLVVADGERAWSLPANGCAAATACAAPLTGSLVLRLAAMACAAPAPSMAASISMIRWIPIVIRSPVQAGTVGTDFIVQVEPGANPGAQVVRIFLLSKKSKIWIQPQPFDGAPGTMPTTYLESTAQYFQVVGQNFDAGTLLDMTPELYTFVAGVEADAERLGVGD
ncbi:MAG: hypothetical protein U0575_06395 [Phycisphaerales bacterium]